MIKVNNRFMFDTNIFNRILDEKIDINNFSKKEYDYFVTHVQYDELNKTRDSERRKKLLKVFKSLHKKEIATESCLMNISKMNKSKMGNGNLHKKILSELQKLEGKKKSKHNQPIDALIVETSLSNSIVLVTNDIKLKKLMGSIGGTAISLQEFIKKLNS
jgi:rRNA-processing protein FCF1